MTEERHELEVIVTPSGEVRVEVKGAKGKACLEYVELFQERVGRVKQKRLTSEYYEPERKSGIVDSERTRTRR
jgi:Protein of unknown function (DUF2997)